MELEINRYLFAPQDKGSSNGGQLPSDDLKAEFLIRLGDLPENSQELISDLSSLFLENDIYRKFKGDFKNIDELAEVLSNQGVEPNDVDLVLRYFNLPKAIQKD